jgi:hypothetical protein
VLYVVNINRERWGGGGEGVYYCHGLQDGALDICLPDTAGDFFTG